ncbi:hypothetical protein [Campylobacter blaseri]|nr:hypothetical protein [Campylobacter blaseri]
MKKMINIIVYDIDTGYLSELLIGKSSLKAVIQQKLKTKIA